MNSRTAMDNLNEPEAASPGVARKRDYTSHLVGLIKNMPTAYTALNLSYRHIAALEKRFGSSVDIDYQRLEEVLAKKKGYNSADGFLGRIHQEKSDYLARQEKDSTPQIVSLIKKHKNIGLAANAVIRQARSLEKAYGKVNLDYAVIEDELDKISWFEPEMLEGLSGYADYLEKTSAETAAKNAELDLGLSSNPIKEVYVEAIYHPPALPSDALVSTSLSTAKKVEVTKPLESLIIANDSLPKVIIDDEVLKESAAYEKLGTPATRDSPYVNNDAIKLVRRNVVLRKPIEEKQTELEKTLEVIVKKDEPTILGESKGIFARSLDYLGGKVAQGLKKAALYATVAGAIFAVSPESKTNFAEANYLTTPQVSLQSPIEAISPVHPINSSKYLPQSDFALTILSKDVKSNLSFVNGYGWEKIPYQQYEFSTPAVITAEQPTLVEKEQHPSIKENAKTKKTTRPHTPQKAMKPAETYLSKVDLSVPTNPELESKLDKAFTGRLYHPGFEQLKSEGLDLNVISGTIDDDIYNGMPKKVLPQKELSSIVIKEPSAPNRVNLESDNKDQGNTPPRGWKKLRNIFSKK